MSQLLAVTFTGTGAVHDTLSTEQYNPEKLRILYSLLSQYFVERSHNKHFGCSFSILPQNHLMIPSGTLKYGTTVFRCHQAGRCIRY
jgi:hypothetical protein